MTAQAALSRDVLRLDAAAEADRIADLVRQTVRRFRRRGVVVGLSGGIDSSVCAALCARALGGDRVLGLLMPDADSAPETTWLGRVAGEAFGIETIVEDVTPTLDMAGCYARRDDAIRQVVPGYGPGFKSKIALPALDQRSAYSLFSLVVESPDGVRTRVRLTRRAYLGVLAATNFKQRVRKMMEYYHADLRQYAVVGTPNRLEYDQGFFVKLGDGAADVKPIAHLYKTQVYQLAELLGVPEAIRRRQPTTDTYSLDQSQDEFYFSLPYHQLDLCLYGLNHGLPAAEVAPAAGLTPQEVERAYQDIRSKRRATRYLHAPAVLVEDVEQTPHEPIR